MTLGEMIDILQSLPAAAKVGLGTPHSYRGFYEQLAFAPCEPRPVADVLATARECVGAVFEGYKGGSYKMNLNTIVVRAARGEYTDDDELTPAFFGIKSKEDLQRENDELRAQIAALTNRTDADQYPDRAALHAAIDELKAVIDALHASIELDRVAMNEKSTGLEAQIAAATNDAQDAAEAAEEMRGERDRTAAALDIARAQLRASQGALRYLIEAPVAHADDNAVEMFAAAMKAKLAQKRAEGRGSWNDPKQCTALDLSMMLKRHIEKGDPVDVANFSMMLHQRGERIIGPMLEPPEFSDLKVRHEDLVIEERRQREALEAAPAKTREELTAFGKYLAASVRDNASPRTTDDELDAIVEEIVDAHYETRDVE